MIIHDVEQGTPEWYALRLGVPTASEFHKIVTPTGRLSAQARKYAIYLVTEKLLNRSLTSVSNLEWMERGREMEPQAVRMYEFEQEAETLPVGFITTDCGRLGASPDRLIKGVNGAAEFKCPAPHTHVEYMVDGFGWDYVPQVQGQMLVGELDFVDRYSFHPELPPPRVRTYRDDGYIFGLVRALVPFLEMLDEMLEQVRARGMFAERARIMTPSDAMDEGYQERGAFDGG